MKEHKNIITFAINEVKNPTLGATKQILAVHKVRNPEDLNTIHMDITEAPNIYKVYFSIEDEPYSFVVLLDNNDNKINIKGSYIEGYSRIYICIYSKTLHPNEITQKIGLIPTKTIAKNELISEKGIIKAAENRWFYEPQKDLPFNFEVKLSYLLDKLKPFSKKIAAFYPKATSCIHICYEGYREWMGGWHLDLSIIKRIAALNAEMDFDLYTSGPDLPLE